MQIVFMEDLYGYYRELNPSGRCGRFDVQCRMRIDDPWRFLREGVSDLTGHVTMDGHAEEAAIEGFMRIDPVFGREAVYDFTFLSRDARYHFQGRKTFRWRCPLASPTMVTGVIEKDGITCGDVEAHFSLLDLPKWLSSFRVRWGLKKTTDAGA